MDAETLKEEIKKEVKKQVKAELIHLNNAIKELKDKCTTLENSQDFISKQFEEITEAWSETKKQSAQKIKPMEVNIQNLKDKVDKANTDLYNLHSELDDVQQYLRRDCIEIVGIPKLEDDDPVELVKELCSSIDVELDEDDISTVHRLPDTRSVKDRMIAKFVRRSKKEEVYNNRQKLHGKTAKSLPSVKADNNNNNSKSRIFINESLTINRKKLFSKVYDFKKKNRYKHLWTMNGKIYLKKDDSGPTYLFTTLEAFEDFEYGNYK
ncbi:uncharacterized protein LOC116303223 [Actinia tenebrosa]|uniref:Uncharacterized protein LOC116303223 n=1 Tax=Actinia tenebrosa TaxID=6105 RepID=A0A6P8INY1_ACTTE|nr:uncharacterized protein LOC116303223 [Actinia tenebrosa]